MNKFYKTVKTISDKVRSFDRRALMVAFSMALIFIAIWGLFAFHLGDFNSAYTSSMSDLIVSETQYESKQISSAFFDRCYAIRYISNTYANVPESEFEDMIAVALRNASQSGTFDELVYIKADGTVCFVDGTKASNDKALSVIQKCDPIADYTVFSNTDDFLISDGSFGVIAPVRRDGQIVGYACGLSKFESMIEAASIRNELPHDEVILDGTGHVLALIKSNDDVIEIDGNPDFFELAESEMTAETFSAFITEYTESVNAMQPGKSRMRTGNEEIIYVYHPISGTEGWVIMNCYPDALIQVRMHRIQTRAITIFLVILLLTLLSSIILIRYIAGERRKLSDLEFRDGLTGVCNRNAFIGQAELVMGENKHLPYNIVCFDVINFRIINETYGHERSDVIIKAMAEACKEAFGHNEAYGRLTADVYVAAVLDDGEDEERIKFIEDFVSKKAKDVYINHPIRIKRGVYNVVDNGESIDRMIDKSNIARKFVNMDSNVLVCHYSDDLLNDARKAEQIESRMHGALLEGEFRPFFQAKYDISTNHVCGAEALVRWIKPDGSVVPPGDFIPLFEKNGFVEKIDFYMLEEVCKYVRQMLDENREVYTISVNQSRYLMNDPEYVNKVQKILLKYNIPVGLVELELTETVFFHERGRMIKMMNDLKRMNVRLSIDDFGTGYSSFNILKDVPFDVLKIDRIFLTDAVHSERSKFILKQIIEMAHGLGMGIICEGVETENQADLLVSIGCDHAQGFLYAKPIPVADFIEKYNNVKEA